jgi:site-specific DNA recombinase
VVIGEPHRAFYGNQYGLTFPLFQHFGVALWVPEVGGEIDPANEAHDLVMSVFGGMSKGERQRVKIRVRAAMSAQAQVEGRFLGGRPPFGYTIADAGPHPNPAKAADGRRLHRLDVDDSAAPVVARIFAEFKDGRGLYAIAEGLTRDGIPAPSAHDRARNSHRSGVAWSKSAIRAILTNPRYTGRQVWNKQRKDEVLLDVNDVALGHVTKLRWNSPEQWIWSETTAHTPIVSVEEFTQVQRILAARGNKPTAQTRKRTTRTYLLRGILFCASCSRRMNSHWVNNAPYYRCRFPQEYALANKVSHPLNVSIREDRIIPRLDRWLTTLFDADSIDTTLDSLYDAHQQAPDRSGLREAARRELADADRKLSQHRAALEAGADPAIVTGWMKEVQAAKLDAQFRMNQINPIPDKRHSKDELASILRELGDMVQLLDDATPQRKIKIYEALGLHLTYHADQSKILVSQIPSQASIDQRFVSEERAHR